MSELLVGAEELGLEGVSVKVRGSGVRLDYIERPEQEHVLSPRENLIVYLNAAVAVIDPTGRQHDLHLLVVTMPCGHSKEYQTENNIPVVSDPCTCKHPKHWFIKYVDLEGNPILPTPKVQSRVAPSKKKKQRGAYSDHE